jgi:hypothetical protein
MMDAPAIMRSECRSTGCFDKRQFRYGDQGWVSMEILSKLGRVKFIIY